MTTFTCKCGKTFEKNTGAATTGNRMPDYGPEHECYGCPFVILITEGWPPATVNYECRGSNKVRFDTYCRIGAAEKDFCISHVWTLDLKFAKRITEFYNTLEGKTQFQNADFVCRASENTDDGTIDFGFSFQHNKKGTSAKKEFYNAFFKDNRRTDVTPEKEKEIVLNQIKEAKAMAQGIIDNPEFTAAMENMESSVAEPIASTAANCIPYRYIDDKSRLMFVSSGIGGIAYMTMYQVEGKYGAPGMHRYSIVALPLRNTFAEAQADLDAIANEKSWTQFDVKPTSEAEKPLESDLSSDYTADAAGELDENELSGQQEQDETPNSENGGIDSDNNSDGSENDSAESDNNPCDWKNASGADEEGDPVPSIPKDVVVGERVSLRNSEFDDILDAADVSLNSLIRALRDKKQHDGELNIKVTVEDYITAFHFGGQVGGKINYSLKSVKISLDDNIEIKFDESGNPVIPYDRQHQVSFDEIQPGRVISPMPVTTTVDGNTGLVEKVHVDGESEDESKQRLSPCDHNDCPFFGVDDDENAGCCFDTEDTDDSSFPGDVWSAVHMESCKRLEVLEAYRGNNPDEEGILGETDYEGSEEMTDDVPPEQVNEKSEICYETTCMFFNSDSPLNCAFNADESFYGAPDGYEADKGDLFYSVEDLNCHKPELLAEYNKIKENDTDEN